MPLDDSDGQSGLRTAVLEGPEAGLKTLEHESYGKVVRGKLVKKFHTGGDKDGFFN